jgi:hypothetical protein
MRDGRPEPEPVRWRAAAVRRRAASDGRKGNPTMEVRVTPENELDENAQRPSDEESPDATQEPQGDERTGPASMSARVHGWTPAPPCGPRR